MTTKSTTNLSLAALFTGAAIILPTIFHWFNLSGQIFLPMHIPILICGFVCGPKYGAIAGIITPLLSSLISGGMPPIYPIAISMSIELAVYAIVCGFMFTKYNSIVSLVVALISGRIAYGIFSLVLSGFSGVPFVFETYITSTFITSLPGIIIQLIFIPSLIFTLQKSKLIKKRV